MRFDATRGAVLVLFSGLLVVVTGCVGETSGPVADVDDLAKLDPAPQFDPVTPGDETAGGETVVPPVVVPKATPKKKVPKKGKDEGFDEELPMIPVEQAGAMVALEAVGAEVKLDFRDRIIDVDLKGAEFDD